MKKVTHACFCHSSWLQVVMCAAQCALWRTTFPSVPPLLLVDTRPGVAWPATRGPKCCSGTTNPTHMRNLRTDCFNRCPNVEVNVRVACPPLTDWWAFSGSTDSVCRSYVSCVGPPARPPPSSDCCSTTAAGLSSETLSSPTGPHWVRLKWGVYEGAFALKTYFQ